MISSIPKLYILLPAYNEESSLKKLVPQIAQTLLPWKMPFEICVVNDGSRDGTAALLEAYPLEWGVRCLSHSTNRGYGAALRTGYIWMAQHARADEAVISLDADTTHSPIYFEPMIRKLAEGFDVVTASYVTLGGHVFGVPLRRRVMSAGANALFRMLYPIAGTHTYTNGFRAYRIGALQRVYQQFGDRLIQETGFAGGTELLLKVCSGGVRTAEVPFDLHYENRGNDSKINIRRTIGGYLSVLRRVKRASR